MVNVYTKEQRDIRSTVKQKLSLAKFTIFDIETTGGNPEKNGITEIFATRFSGSESQNTFHSLINPKMAIPPIVRRITGITNSMVRNAPTIHSVMPKFIDFIGDSILVSHNTIGDMKFLEFYGQKVCRQRINNFYLCTHLLVDKLCPEVPKKNLKGLAKYFNITATDFHRAEQDAIVTLEIFKILVSKLQKLSINTVEEAIRFQGDYFSSVRLGWRIPQHKIEALPQNPGVIVIKNSQQGKLFFSSAANLRTEANRLKRFEAIPKPLAKIILPADDLEYQVHDHLFGALLQEADLLKEKQPSFLPFLWHNRCLRLLNVRIRNKRSIYIDISPISEKTILSYGPVTHFRPYLKFMEELALLFDVRKRHAGIELPREYLPFLKILFSKKTPHHDQSLASVIYLRLVNKVVHLFRSKRLKLLIANLAKSNLVFPENFRFALRESGVLFVKSNNSQQLSAIIIKNSLPHLQLNLKSDLQSNLNDRKFCSMLVKQLKAKTVRHHQVPLTMAEAAQANAVLWHIYDYKSDDHVFFEKDQLEQMAKHNF